MKALITLLLAVFILSCTPEPVIIPPAPDPYGYFTVYNDVEDMLRIEVVTDDEHLNGVEDSIWIVDTSINLDSASVVTFRSIRKYIPLGEWMTVRVMAGHQYYCHTFWYELGGAPWQDNLFFNLDNGEEYEYSPQQ